MDNPTAAYEFKLGAQEPNESITVAIDRTRAALRALGMFQITGTNPFWSRYPDLAHHQRLIALSVDTNSHPPVLVLDTTDEVYRFSEPGITIGVDGAVTISEGDETNVFSSEPEED